MPKFEKQDDILNENMLCHLPTLYWSNRESCCQDNNILSIESLIFLHHFHYFDIIQIEGELYIFFCPLSSSSGLLNLGGKIRHCNRKTKIIIVLDIFYYRDLLLFDTYIDLRLNTWEQDRKCQRNFKLASYAESIYCYCN